MAVFQGSYSRPLIRMLPVRRGDVLPLTKRDSRPQKSASQDTNLLNRGKAWITSNRNHLTFWEGPGSKQTSKKLGDQQLRAIRRNLHWSYPQLAELPCRYAKGNNNRNHRHLKWEAATSTLQREIDEGSSSVTAQTICDCPAFGSSETKRNENGGLLTQ